MVDQNVMKKRTKKLKKKTDGNYRSVKAEVENAFTPRVAGVDLEPGRGLE